MLKLKPDRRTVLCGIVYSVFFSALFVIGRVIKPLDGIARAFGLKAVACIAGLSIVAFAGYIAVYFLAERSPLETRTFKFEKRLHLILFFALLILWIPCFLSVGPRITGDAGAMIGQAISGGLNDKNPVLYTLILRAVLLPFYNAGKITLGTYVYCSLQMIFVAFILSYMLAWLRKKGCSLIIVVFSLVFFSFPVFAAFSVTFWKDIPYGAVFVLYVVILYEICESKGEYLDKRANVAKLVAVCLALCFLRGSGWLVVLSSSLVLFFVYKKRFKKFGLVLIALLIAVKIITGPVYDALGLSSPLGAVESAAIPIQQVAYAVKSGAKLSDEQTDTLAKFIEPETMAAIYDSSSVDFIKFSPDFDSDYFNANMGEFLRLWLSLMPQNIVGYTKALLLETTGYWRIGFESNHSLWNGEGHDYYGIQQIDFLGKALGSDCQSFFMSHTQMMISLASLVWFMLLVATLLINKKRYKYLVPLAPILFVWLGLMVSAPAYSNLRYILMLPYSLPIIIYILCYKCRIKLK